jgi:ribosomal protein S18 acetylase RimI-like enzyme
MDIQIDAQAFARLRSGDITALTDAATVATFYRDGLTPEQVAANHRIVNISESVCAQAAISAHQRLAAAFIDDELAGYVVATRHSPDDLELDWMMVHPRHHGAGVARALMTKGLTWLGTDRPIWLNVIRHNARAIGFYRKFGFRIDPDARTSHVVPHWIMRRPPGPLDDLPGPDEHRTACGPK